MSKKSLLVSFVLIALMAGGVAWGQEGAAPPAFEGSGCCAPACCWTPCCWDPCPAPTCPTPCYTYSPCCNWGCGWGCGPNIWTPIFSIGFGGGCCW